MDSDIMLNKRSETIVFFSFISVFFLLEAAFLYFVPDYFGIKYFDLGISWDFVFILLTISCFFTFALLRVHSLNFFSWTDEHLVVKGSLAAFVFFIEITALVFCLFFLYGLIFYAVEILLSLLYSFIEFISMYAF